MTEMTENKKVSQMDIDHLKMIRKNVNRFIKQCSKKFDKEGTLLLDIAPQVHEGASPYFRKAKIETLDIDPESGSTYIADLCNNNENLIPANHFDFIVCTEVLEHTLNPFNAVKEIKRILKTDGHIFLSTPFNVRIHNPLPDCWRFTIHGLNYLFQDFRIIETNELETKDRFLMPIQFTLVAQKT
jgi:SAM-dependent methyltransferase